MSFIIEYKTYLCQYCPQEVRRSGGKRKYTCITCGYLKKDELTKKQRKFKGDKMPIGYNTVNCQFCNEEIKRMMSNTGKFICFDCKGKQQKEYYKKRLLTSGGFKNKKITVNKS